MWTIQQIGENEWQVLRGVEVVLTTETYDAAVAHIAEQLRVAALAEDTTTITDGGDGLLPETWVDAGGIFFSEPTGDGRDFTNCQWTWRDPEQVPVPLMLQTSTDIGHFGAELAGLVQTIAAESGTGHATGRFYDSDKGREARQLLLGGRRFGVSVDPGSVDASFECTEYDDEGWCLAERIEFHAYEVIGLTMTPFAGFQNAMIQLDTTTAITAGATTFADLPLSDREAAWDGAAAEGRVRKACSSDGSGEPDTMDWQRYGKAFFWYDAENAEQFGSYKLGFADMDGSTMQANWGGVTAAAGAVQGARGGVDIPDGDMDSVKNHIAKYYDKAAKQYDDDTITPPWSAQSAGGAPGGSELAMDHMVTDHEFEDENDDGYCDYCVNSDVNGDCQQVCGAIESMHGDMQDNQDGGDGGDNTDQQDMGVQASAALTIPLTPPSDWFNLPEPQMGMTGMSDVYGMDVSELLVEQPDGGLAVPWQILDNGLVYGHIARWGERHVAFPGSRVTPPDSETAYAHFHVGQVVCDDGARVATGTLVVGCEHAPLRGITPSEARDFYAHSGFGWANVRVTSGQYGVWACGVLRPDVTPQQVRVLRSLAPSGDWRRIGRSLEMIGTVMVSVPGFPVARETITASGLDLVADSPRTAGVVASGETTALVAAGMVYRCGECAKRAREEALARKGGGNENVVPETIARELRGISALLGVLDRRTRHLRVAAVDDLRSRILGGE